jgi:hypothetical protein
LNCATSSVQAQWTSNGNNINNTNSGNVGVGTTTPTAKVQIAPTTFTGGTELVLGNDPGYQGWSLFVNSSKTGPSSGAAGFGGSFTSNGTGQSLFGVTIQPIFTAYASGSDNAYGLHIAPTYSGTWTHKYGLYVTGESKNYFSNRVGIGTNAPGYQLDVQGGSINSSGGLCIAGDCKSAWSQVGSTQWTTSGTTINYGTGNVGIGVASPTTKLDVNGTVNATALTVSGSPIVSSQWATSGTTINYGTGNVGIGVGSPTTKLDVNGTVNATGLTVSGSPVVSSQWATSGTTINYGTGNVGIGVASPTTKLDVNGTVNATGLTVSGSPLVSSQWATSGTTINYATGNVGVATAAPTEKLHVTGNIKVTGSIDVGGNINAKYQDMAEWVESSQELPAGTVVVLDPTKSNQVIASSQSYDSRVAGVISLQPGLALGERGQGRVLVATTGRVKVKVDATNGGINIGDLLVTSEKEGVAMKSVPVDVGGVHMHRPGTLIGKALEPLASGTGEILVLLSLQ